LHHTWQDSRRIRGRICLENRNRSANRQIYQSKMGRGIGGTGKPHLPTAPPFKELRIDPMRNGHI